MVLSLPCLGSKDNVPLREEEWSEGGQAAHLSKPLSGLMWRKLLPMKRQ